MTALHVGHCQAACNKHMLCGSQLLCVVGAQSVFCALGADIVAAVFTQQHLRAQAQGLASLGSHD